MYFCQVLFLIKINFYHQLCIRVLSYLWLLKIYNIFRNQGEYLVNLKLFLLFSMIVLRQILICILVLFQFLYLFQDDLITFQSKTLPQYHILQQIFLNNIHRIQEQHKYCKLLYLKLKKFIYRKKMMIKFHFLIKRNQVLLIFRMLIHIIILFIYCLIFKNR